MPDRLRAPLAAATLLLSACAAPVVIPTSTPSAAASQSPRELLFAVLEVASSESPPAHDTVAIVGLDGKARAKATFQPRQIAMIGNAAPLLQPEARVAAGGVYYADRSGTIRRMTANQQINRVVFFPISQQQQELGFAVSPEGADFDASVVTLPQLVAPGGDNPAPFPVMGPGAIHLEIAHARAAGLTTTLVSSDVPQTTPQRGIVNVVGWNRLGPLATTDTPLGTQQGNQGRLWFGSLVHLDTHGHTTAILGGPSCKAVAVTDNDAVACLSDSYDSIEIRDASGALLWKLPSPAGGDQYLGPYALAADASRIAIGGGMAGPAVYSRTGARVVLPSNFKPRAWLDQGSLVGYLGDTADGPGEIGFLRLSAPGETIDLGFKGTYVGLIQAGPTTAGP